VWGISNGCRGASAGRGHHRKLEAEVCEGGIASRREKKKGQKYSRKTLLDDAIKCAEGEANIQRLLLKRKRSEIQTA